MFSDDRYAINSVLRAARILESFLMETSTLTNAELAKKLDLNKSAITRLLQSPAKAGFISRDDHTRRYCLSYKLPQISSAYIKNTSLHVEGRPLLEQLYTSGTSEGLNHNSNKPIDIVCRFGGNIMSYRSPIAAAN